MNIFKHTFIWIVILGQTPAIAQVHDQEALKKVQIEERLGAQISIEDLEFVDENGAKQRLKHYFQDNKPVLISMIYYGCPSLCGFLLNGKVDAMKKLDWSVGEQYRVLTFSIDPSEGPELALAKKKSYLEVYERSGAQSDWHFLTGEESQIKQLADELGFGYQYVEETGEYAHSAGIFVLTPKAVVSRVLFGIQFEPKDLKLALLEASDGKIGSVVDKFLMYCFRYDPDSKGYSLQALRLVQAGGGIFIILLAGYLFVFWRRETRKKRV